MEGDLEKVEKVLDAGRIPAVMERGQAGCLVIGRAAGIAAAEAAKQNVAVNAVDVGKVQDGLRKQNTVLDYAKS